jgi:hypothetical protein
LTTVDAINKTMNRADLLSRQAGVVVDELNALIRDLYGRGLRITSWYGSLPPPSERSQPTLLPALLIRRNAPLDTLLRRKCDIEGAELLFIQNYPELLGKVTPSRAAAPETGAARALIRVEL